MAQYSPTYPQSLKPVIAHYWDKDKRTAFPIMAIWNGKFWKDPATNRPIPWPIIGWSAVSGPPFPSCPI
jgi:hypothetical protein